MSTRVAGWVAVVAIFAVAGFSVADEAVIGDLTVSGDAVIAGGLSTGSAASIGGSAVVLGSLTVSGELDVGGNVTGVETLSVNVLASLADVVCPSIKQDQVFRFDVSHLGKAWTDTFSIIRSFPLAMMAYEGTVEKVVVYVDSLGSGWDSLTVDVFKTGDADTSLLTTVPCISPGLCYLKAGSDWVSSEDCGRAAVMDPAEKDITTAHVLTMDAVFYGAKSNPPAGLVVWVYFRPDY